MRMITGGLLIGLMALIPSRILAADVALLISNANISGQPNARAIDSELRSLISAYRTDGYRVIFERGENPAELEEKLRQFEGLSKSADRVVIHMIGHFKPTPQNMFLQPVNYKSESFVELYRSALSVEMAYDLLAHRPGRNALILAGSRSDDAAKIQARGHLPSGLLILTGEGLAVNRAIRDAFLTGATGLEMRKQPGVVALGFVTDMALSSASAASVPSPSTNATDAALVEMRVWREATQNGSQEALQRYIDRYPNGLFLGEARARLRAFAPQKPLEQTVEESLALSRADRRRIQQNLTLLGFDTRGVDGVFGRGSRAAIGRWQSSEGFRATGFLDGAQIRVLTEKARIKAEADRATKERDDLAYWQQTGSGTNVQGLRNYLARYPNGLFATQAKQALEQAERDTQVQQNQAYIQRENALNMNGQTRALVEQRLNGLGYKVGAVDGNFTQETRVAIRDFQQKAGINPTGYMDNQTVTKLVASIFR